MASNIFNDLLLSYLQFLYLLIVFNFKLMNGTLQQNHLLPLLLEVDSHIFRNLVIWREKERGTQDRKGSQKKRDRKA
jgi:hypothetical protein